MCCQQFNEIWFSILLFHFFFLEFFSLKLALPLLYLYVPWNRIFLVFFSYSFFKRCRSWFPSKTYILTIGFLPADFTIQFQWKNFNYTQHILIFDTRTLLCFVLFLSLWNFSLFLSDGNDNTAINKMRLCFIY